MIDRSEAEGRAREVVASYGRAGVECVVLQEHTREEPFGWIFFYQSAAHVRTGDPTERLAGNAPLVVFRDTGEVRAMGTARPLDHYLVVIRHEWARRQEQRP